MSVPYGPDEAADEPPQAPSPCTPQEQLARLLARALNSFELPEETVRSVEGALAHDSALQSAYHSASLHHETYRHTWLLADGGTLTLWELSHHTLPPGVLGGSAHCELYTDPEEWRTAQARLVPTPGMPYFELAQPEGALPAIPGPRPTYALDNSPDHARRLLRRAENQDRPGPATARLLSMACGHRITQSFGRSLPANEKAGRSFSLYEHAFLLCDGSEVSLWEVEHTATEDGRHMCEVYLSARAAAEAMRRRASRVR
ncbi:DUF6227 family protein [Streptomyces physcomitrii]|uniref:DUF6227 family protein n=1 Tax=Streptomyces physcomitrii TaxID=2724184 RepID=UPI0033FA855D